MTTILPLNQFMRTKKCYKKMFFCLLELSIVSSYFLCDLVLEQYSKKPITHKKFRQSLWESLVHEKCSLVEECKKLSKADYPVLHLMKG